MKAFAVMNETVRGKEYKFPEAPVNEPQATMNRKQCLIKDFWKVLKLLTTWRYSLCIFNTVNYEIDYVMTLLKYLYAFSTFS